ncbi:MAG: ABC transporter ATP-binding protein [Gammaproteobacteria bacterium]|jgi:ABC-2 type transport system ATP-binding protein
MVTQALSIENLCKTYKGGHQALQDVSLEVELGDFFALLGPNGAGKSTAIGIISSLVNKDSGRVEVMGFDLDKDPVKVKEQIGLVPQEFNFNQFEPVGEIVVNQAGFYGIPRKEALVRAKKYLTQLDLWSKRDAESRSLSGGMKRRLMIARALVHEPRLLILDEPTAGVDIEIRRSMWDFLREINRSGTTIILTTHYLEEAESLCRNIAIISCGNIVEKSGISELLKRMHRQSFIVSSREKIAAIDLLEKYQPELLDDTTLELSLHQDTDMNVMFTDLSRAGIDVVGLRNKQNRLEQMFIEMVSNPKNLCKPEQVTGK